MSTFLWPGNSYGTVKGFFVVNPWYVKTDKYLSSFTGKLSTGRDQSKYIKNVEISISEESQKGDAFFV